MTRLKNISKKNERKKFKSIWVNLTTLSPTTSYQDKKKIDFKKKEPNKKGPI
jgi:hypothetical protein